MIFSFNFELWHVNHSNYSDDYEDKDTEVVVVRYDGETAQVLDKRQIGLRTISTGLYTVDIKGYWW